MNLRIIPQDRTIFNGNKHIGYIDERDDVYILIKDRAHKIGNVDRVSEALTLVREWYKNDA